MPNEIDHSTIAWGDESVRVIARPPCYVMAACIMSAESVSLGEGLERLKPKDAKKLHWRELDDKKRKEALRIIEATPPKTIIVTAAPLISNKQERARRKCLEALLVALESYGVEQLVLESRDGYLDRKDIEHLIALRRSKTIKGIDIAHKTGNDDPNLYVPDQILGAYGDIISANRKHTWIDNWKSVEQSCVFQQVTP